jgi:hypothetical protein
MHIVNYKIADLVHPEYNPRQITDKEFGDLKKSIEKFDCVEPAVVNTLTARKNIIIGGNQRVRVAQALGWKTFPCVEVSLPLEKEKELNVRLNKNNGKWDWDILANQFEVDDLIDWGFVKEELSIHSDDLDIGDMNKDYLQESDIDFEVISFYVPETIKKQIERVINFITDGRSVISSFPSMEIDLEKFEPIKNMSDRKITREEAFYAFIAISFYNNLLSMGKRGKKIFKTEFLLDEKQLNGLYKKIFVKIKEKYPEGYPRNPINQAILDILND